MGITANAGLAKGDSYRPNEDVQEHGKGGHKAREVLASSSS